MSQPPVERSTVITESTPGCRCGCCKGPIRLGLDGIYYHANVPDYLGTLVRQIEPIPDDGTTDITPSI